jgi:hypothetical protein
MDKIDFVITYLDGEDQAWVNERDRYREKLHNAATGENGDSRYRNMNNFHYLLRSIECFAPWVNKIHIVTWGHIPEWLNVDNPKIHVVQHKDYIPSEYLPTFNSNAIELNFDRIEGLSECFVNFNDDIFLNSPTQPEDFFVEGLPRLQLMYAPFMPSDALFSSNILALNQALDTRWRIDKKMFSLKNGFFAFCANFYMLPLLKFYGKYLGFREDHLTMPLTKTLYHEVRERLSDDFDFVSRSRFRNSCDVRSISIWVMLDYARAMGRFAPLKSFKFGKLVNLGTDVDFDAVLRSRYKVLCLEDGEYVSSDDFDGVIKKLNSSLEKKFPAKSKFER